MTDEIFDSTESLNWRPFVGANYQNADYKILFIGESHYLGDGVHSNAFKKDFTRWIVGEMGIEEYDYRSKFFKNINKMFVKDNTRNFWDKIAFYNFIQRPMDGIVNRPMKEDFVKGWGNFVEITKILKPDLCIFLGTTSANYLNEFSNKHNLGCTQVTWHERINGSYLKKSQIKIEDKFVDLVFIKHPSMAFSTDKWKEELIKLYPKEINFLTN